MGDEAEDDVVEDDTEVPTLVLPPPPVVADGGESTISYVGSYTQDFIDSRPGRTDHLTAIDPHSVPSYIRDDNWSLFWGLSEARVEQIQHRLIDGGFMDEGHVRDWGRWNDGEASAMFSVMDIANGTNRTYSEVMSAAIQAGGLDRGSGGSGRLPPTIRLSNPDDLKAAFKQVARQKHGGIFVEDDQLDGMVKSFQEQERAFQLAAAGGGEVTSSPSAQTFAEGEFEASDPGGADANRFQSMTRVLQNLVGEANG